MSDNEPKDNKLTWHWLAVAISVGLLIYNYFSMWDMMSTVILLVLVLILVGFTLAEGKGDEREIYHRLLASRAGFLVGLLILSLGILDEVIINHQPAIWLIYGLAGMVLGKVVGLIWGRVKH
jgi:hypothetical protein